MNGAEVSLYLLLKNIDRTQIQPVVILPSSGPLKDRLRALGIDVHEVRVPWWVRMESDGQSLFERFKREVRTVRQLCQIIRQEGIQIVYTNSLVVCSGAISAFIRRRPHIWHVREILKDHPVLKSVLPVKALLKLVLAMSKKVVANSNATKQQFDRVKPRRDKIKVIYNSVEIAEASESNTQAALRTVEVGDWSAAIVGSITKHKGQDVAIRAIAIAKKLIPNIRLMLIGDGTNGYIRHLEQLIQDLGLVKNVSFEGFCDDVAGILAQCRILICPSLIEPFGRTAIEAMSVGIPVIASDTGGLREIVREGVTGHLVPPGDYMGIAEKICELYRNPERVRKMGESGRRTAKENFSAERLTRNIVALINDVAHSPQAMNRPVDTGGVGTH